MSAYKEFTGKTVEEALRAAREEFGAELNDLDFEILTPGSRGVLGMGAEPARIVAAPRQALGGAAPKREAAASVPLPAPPARDYADRDRGDRGPRRDDRGDRGPRRDDRGPRRDGPTAAHAPPTARARIVVHVRTVRRARTADPVPTIARATTAPTAARAATTAPTAARAAMIARRAAPAPPTCPPPKPPRSRPLAGRSPAERAELEAAEASPEALAAGQRILETLMGHLGFDARVEVAAGETSRLNVVAQGDDRDALGALIGRKGERLSALQHLVNLMLSKEMGAWTRVLVDVEDYRGRRERQLRELAERAAARVVETGKMLQLEPMPALERRWIHLTLRDHAAVATQSIGEEPNRRVVLVPRVS